MAEYANPPLWGSQPSDGQVPVYSAATDTLAPTPKSAIAGGAMYGDGSDGAQTFDGTSTVLGLVPASEVYTLTRDVYLADGSAINSGVTVKAAGFRIFCAGTLTINGTVSANGGNAAANVGGTAPASHAIGGGAAGSAGATAAGTAGSTSTSALGGASGAGGAGSGHAAGAAGTVALPANPFPWRSSTGGILGVDISASLTAGSLVPFSGGAGGASGGGDGTNASGAGGAGGGVVVLAAKTIAGTGTVSANGGNGGVPATGNCGGGGGGGGGFVFIVSSSVASGAIPGLTVTASAGAAGAGVGTGTAGAVGAAGRTVLVG